MNFFIRSFAAILIVISISSCASIPASTATLSQELIAEANSMHELNLALVNKLFDERKDKVNNFINNQYIPKYVENFKAKIPPGVDVSAELTNILKSVMPVINRKRDSLQGLLDVQRHEMIASLNGNYAKYQQASATLQNLISSAVKLKQTEANTLQQIQSLTKTHLNIGKIQSHLDSLLIKTGKGFHKLLNIESTIRGNN